MNDVVYNYTFNDNNYGFSYVEDCTMSSSIENGNYYNCVLSSSNNSSLTYYINNGYFENCIINGYNVYGGYFKNCVIYSGLTNGQWFNGTWDSNATNTFNLNTWYNGVWNNGTISLFTNTFNWKDGIFNNGYIYGNFNFIWENGIVNNGQLNNINWITGTFNNGSIIDSEWSGGTFNDGYFGHLSTFGPPPVLVTGIMVHLIMEWHKSTYFYNGTFNNGNYNQCYFIDNSLQNTYIIINNGTYDSCIISGCSFNNGTILDSNWYKGIFYNGNFNNNSYWNDGIFYNGTFNNSTWNNGNFNNGTINNSQWNNGTFNNGVSNTTNFKNCTWNNGTFNNGCFGYTTTGVCNWYNGSFNSGIFGSLVTNSALTCDYELLYTVNVLIFTGTTIFQYSSFTEFLLSGASGVYTFNIFSPNDYIIVPLSRSMPAWGYLGSNKYYVAVKNHTPNTPLTAGDIFSVIFPNTNDNWYNGNFYKDTFKGMWYGGNWNGGIWYGWNEITNSTQTPTQQFNQFQPLHNEPFTPSFVQSPIIFSGGQVQTRDYTG